MASGIDSGKRRIKVSRETVLLLVFLALSIVLIYRLYRLQIIDGAKYRENFSMQTTRTRTIKSTRGNIYDRNGNILAASELSYSLTIEDNGDYKTNREKALSLNSEAYKISKMLKEGGNKVSVPFNIIISGGKYEYDVTGFSLERFRADVYGHAYIDDLEEEERVSSADEMMKYLISEDGFAIKREKKPYTDDELKEYGLPKDLTEAELLDIVKIRYALFTTSYQKYLPVTIATNLDEKLVARFIENKDSLTGIEIVEDTKRVYTDPIYFSSIVGYTGPVSAEDLAELKEQSTEYDNQSIVGKVGIERIMETTLQGSKGSEVVHVDNMGKVLSIEENSRRDPIAGNDVYLTIDKDLQIAAYRMLEEKIAGILVNVIVPGKEADLTVEDESLLKIPSYDVYNALIKNSIIDIHHFSSGEASDTEKEVKAAFDKKQDAVFTALNQQLTGSGPVAYKDLSSEMQEYQKYIVEDLLMNKTGILNNATIDKTDNTYLAWTRDMSISMQEYLTYAASKNWIDITEIVPYESYVDSIEIYRALSEYIENYLRDDDQFAKLLYKNMLFEDSISGTQIIQIMYDQGKLDKNDESYAMFNAGYKTVYDTMIDKIMNLDITPDMLALDPCSGSVVIVDPRSGEVRACVSYPGYDNNRLANSMDSEYYRKLVNDLSSPFYNKATQAKTAPGSTFKLITTTAGLSEGIINEYSQYNCLGIFDETETPLRCWNRIGHGILDIRSAIMESCNVYFCNIAYDMGINEEGEWSDSLSLGKLQSYAELYDMDKPSGIEIQESQPQVSDLSAIQSSIGQGTHSYTTTQMARYAATLANGGTSYNISLLDKSTDPEGVIIEDFSPEIRNRIILPESTWNVIHDGMRMMIQHRKEFNDMPILVSGKTGTAQESKIRPPHALFIGYAPSNNPEIAIAVRISNGYSSMNTLSLSKDILKYYFELSEEEELITGHAATENFTNEMAD